MFNNIMVPVDLAHKAKLTRALDCAADLASHYGAKVTYVGVTSSAPSSVAHTPAEFAEKLAAFAAEQAASHGISATSQAELAHDPAADVDEALLRAAKATGTDLVVMQSHIPNVMDHVWPSNGGRVAEHAKCSVMIVRG
ncbi:universal stress protein [Rhodobacteraceae bacterium NNCM2]|nr:universal stress protein [Coraliihabitans acroporae]